MSLEDQTRFVGNIFTAALGPKAVTAAAGRARSIAGAGRASSPGAVAPASSPSALLAGREAEAAAISRGGLVKNTSVFRPTAEMIDSAAFKVIVGEAKYTARGKPVGTILDAAATELKSGSSPLDLTYQLRLQTYHGLISGTGHTIRTSRPLTPTAAEYFSRWGVDVTDLR